MRRSTWCTTLCALFAAALSAKQVRVLVVQGEIPQKDLTRPTYRVLVPEIGALSKSNGPLLHDGWSRVEMVTTQGQSLQCVVPTPAPSPPASPARTLGADTYDDVAGLMRGYEKQCFERNEGWWTFKFCYGDSLTQYHRATSDEEKEESYVLGRFDADFDSARRQEATDVPRPKAPFTQLMGNGTICDVTKQPRVTLVRYICADDTSQISSIANADGELFLIQALREVATCVYELDLVSSAICNQKLYRRSALDIVCDMAEGQTPFAGLAALHNRKGKATLTL